MKKKVITLIPARGGSVGIPRKNIVDMDGKPLISYAIEASINSSVNETWVSTEDDEISEVSRQYGAQVINRPLDLAHKDASSESALIHFIENFGNFDILIFLQATCPFIQASDIDKAVDLMEKYDSILSVTKFDQFIWEGSVPMYDINDRKRRQDREQAYIETGSMFATTVNGLLKTNNRINGSVGFVEVPRWRSIDIDTSEDLELARSIMRFNREK